MRLVRAMCLVLLLVPLLPVLTCAEAHSHADTPTVAGHEAAHGAKDAQRDDEPARSRRGHDHEQCIVARLVGGTSVLPAPSMSTVPPMATATRLAYAMTEPLAVARAPHRSHNLPRGPPSQA